MVMVGHPKWMLPAGSAKLESLGNTITTVQFKGPVAPQLVTAPTTPREFFEFRNMLKEDFMQHADVSMTGRGDPPPGVTAAVALQYLSEMENERWNESVLKYNEAILQVAIQTIAVGGDYYDEKDERMIRLLGQNNKWMSIAFDVAHLSKDYDVRIQSSSALPESKAAKTEYLLFLNERFPERVDADSVLNMLDIASSEKFINVSTVSVRAAEAENEILMSENSTRKVSPPSDEEDHVQHWKCHVRKMREWSFKNQVPKDIQERFKEHVMAHEMMMSKKGLTNPAYGQSLQPVMLEGFPLLFQAQDSDVLSEPDPLDDMSADLGALPPQDPGLPYNMPPVGAPQIGGELSQEQQMASNLPGEPVNSEPPNMEQQLSGQPVPALQPTSQQ
jgi:hypothetical protein